MGAIAAAVSKKNENVIPHVFTMLKQLTHRGTDAHGIAVSNLVNIRNSLEDISIEKINSPIALGHNFSKILPRDCPQPVQGEGFSLVFEGRLFSCPSVSDVSEIMRMLNPDPQRNACQIIKKIDGSFIFAIAYSNKLLIGQDTIGTRSLYYGENATTCAAASECKALWAIGIEKIKTFPPGNLASINREGFTITPIKTISQPAWQYMGIDEAVQRLQHLLLESTRKRVSDTKRIVISFSGGLDSAVIAQLAKICGADVHLVCVGLEGQPEVEYAEAAAEALELPIHVNTYTVDDVEQSLPKALWLIEKPDVLDASIAIPINWVAETASTIGCHILLAGQGGDELFAGYQRYLKEYVQLGAEAVQRILFHDIESCYEKNFQRDEKIYSYHKIELRLPYSDLEVVNLASSLPIELKIASKTDNLRKRVLRQLAQILGIPPFIVNRPKNAIQYATGVSKSLRRLAKDAGLLQREYIKKVFREVYPNISCNN